MGVESLLAGVLMLTVLLVVAALWLVLVRRPIAATYVLIAAYIATQAIAERVGLQITVAGFTIYALDVVSTLMLIIGVSRLLAAETPRSLARPLLILVALLGLHLAWGATAHGLQPAVTSGRAWLHFIGPLVYAACVIPHWNRASFRPLIFGALALSVYAFAFIARYGLHGANTPLEIGGRLSFDSRALTGTAALFIVQCILIVVSARLVRSPVWFVAVAAMCATVALAQFRTVWVIAAIALAIAYLKWARVAIFANEHAALLAMSAVFLVAPVAAYAAASSSAFAYSVESATGRDSTLRWRTESWNSLLKEHSSPTDIALGLPTGTSLARRLDGQIVDRSPHNVYVDSLLSFGLLGPLVIGWLGVLIIKRRHVAAATLELSATVVVLLVVAEALFGVTTMFGPVQGILTGMLLQAAFSARRTTPDDDGLVEA
jgi:hypothetical protein